MRKILLDTTYLLPLFGFNIKISEKFEKKLKLLWKEGLSGYNLHICSASLIESMYMLNRQYKKQNNEEILGIYPLVLPSITSSNTVELIDNFVNPEISKLTNQIRIFGHKDLMDCWIAATANSLNAVFLTEDAPLTKVLKSIPDFKSLEIWTWKQFIQNTGF